MVSDKVCYFNHGTSMIHVSPNHVATAGEKLFDDYLTEEELVQEFEHYIHAKHNSDVLIQIFELEKTITPRRRDEAILGIDNGWLSNIREEIDTLRNSLIIIED